MADDNSLATLQTQLIDPLFRHPKFEKVQDLDKGSFGHVQLARDKRTGELVAIKFMKRGSKYITRHVEREIISHSLLKHPHVVELKEVILTPGHLGIVLEFATGGNLFERVVKVGGLCETEARWFFQQHILGLDYCHRVGVVSRDIKLENSLLMSAQEGHFGPMMKLADFGYAKHEGLDSCPHSVVGTPAYIAPEVIMGDGRGYNGKKSDIWSSGVLLYVMLFCRYPFDDLSGGDPPPPVPGQGGKWKIYDRIRRGEYTIPVDRAVSRECLDLISKMLVPNPDQRITLAQIMRHPWYMHGLPLDALKYNDEYLNTSPHSQNMARNCQSCVQSIVEEARTQPCLMEIPGYEPDTELPDRLEPCSESFDVEGIDPYYLRSTSLEASYH